MNRNVIIAIGGLFFGFGLAYSTMAQQEVVLSFVRFQDFGLLLVMATAMVFTYFAFTWYPKLKKRSLSGKPFDQLSDVVNKEIIIGAVLFGIGWGIAGICPGSAIASLGVGNFKVLYALAGLFVGAFIHDYFLKKKSC